MCLFVHYVATCYNIDKIEDLAPLQCYTQDLLFELRNIIHLKEMLIILFENSSSLILFRISAPTNTILQNIEYSDVYHTTVLRMKWIRAIYKKNEDDNNDDDDNDDADDDIPKKVSFCDVYIT